MIGLSFGKVFAFNRKCFFCSTKLNYLFFFCIIFIFSYFSCLEMESPWGKNQHLRHLLFFVFHHGQKAAEASRDISNVHGEDVIGESAAQKWFAKFKNGDFELDDTPGSRRPTEFNEEHLKALLKEDGHQTSCELAKKWTVIKRWSSIILIQWDLPKNSEPGCLTKSTKKIVFKSLLNTSPAIEQHTVINSAFLYQIVTGDEKWCLYINMKQRKGWVTPGDTPKPRVKQDLHPKKKMICI